MSEFKCSICQISFRRKDYLQKHLQRKYPCKVVEIENPKKRITENHRESLRITENHSNKNEPINEEKYAACEYCNISILKRSLNRHQRNSCLSIPNSKHKKLVEKYNNNKKHKNALSIINNNNTTINNNNTTNNNLNNCLNTNITNNITLKINPFGEENLDFLTNEDKLKIVNRCYMGVPELIKRIHNIPENHNIFISNLKNNVMAILNKKNELEYNDYNEICEQLIEKNMNRLDDYFMEFESQLKASVKKRMRTVIEKNYEGELTDKYMEDIKYYLMNISRKNKKEMNDFIDQIEKQVQLQKQK